MAYRVEIGSRADGQLQELDPIVGAAVDSEGFRELSAKIGLLFSLPDLALGSITGRT